MAARHTFGRDAARSLGRNSQVTLQGDRQQTYSAPKQLLRLPAVIERTGLSKTAIYTTPGFPRPVKLTLVASAWVASEVDAWIDARMAERDASQR